MCERVGKDVEQRGGVLAALDVEGRDDELGEAVQVTAGHLERQQHQYRQPVKEIVHRRTGKRSANTTFSETSHKHHRYAPFMKI